MLSFSKNSQWIVSVAAIKLKRVFNSLMVFVVRVFLAAKTFSPDTWVADVAPRADVLALLMRFLLYSCCFKREARTLLLSAKPNKFPKEHWMIGTEKQLTEERTKLRESYRWGKPIIGCLWILRLPKQCGIREHMNFDFDPSCWWIIHQSYSRPTKCVQVLQDLHVACVLRLVNVFFCCCTDFIKSCVFGCQTYTPVVPAWLILPVVSYLCTSFSTWPLIRRTRVGSSRLEKQTLTLDRRKTG